MTYALSRLHEVLDSLLPGEMAHKVMGIGVIGQVGGNFVIQAEHHTLRIPDLFHPQLLEIVYGYGAGG